MIYSYKIEDGGEDGDHNSLTGTTVYKETVDIGKWMFVKSFGGFRFKIPLEYGTSIDAALLTLYLDSVEGKQSDRQDIIFYVSTERDALPLSYGIDRKYSDIFVRYDNVKLEENNWNTFEITPLINKKVNEYQWHSNNHILIKVDINVNNELYRFGSADIVPTSAAILTIEYNNPTLIIESDENYNEDVYVLKTEYPVQDVVLGELELHPEEISFEYTKTEKNYNLGVSSLGVKIKERMNFNEGNILSEYVGRIVPFKCFDDYFNAIVSSCNLDYDFSFVNVNLSLIII